MSANKRELSGWNLIRKRSILPYYSYLRLLNSLRRFEMRSTYTQEIFMNQSNTVTIAWFKQEIWWNLLYKVLIFSPICQVIGTDPTRRRVAPGRPEALCYCPGRIYSLSPRHLMASPLSLTQAYMHPSWLTKHRECITGQVASYLRLALLCIHVPPPYEAGYWRFTSGECPIPAAVPPSDISHKSGSRRGSNLWPSPDRLSLQSTQPPTPIFS